MCTFLNKKDCADREVIPPIDEGSKGSVFSVTYVFVVGGNNWPALRALSKLPQDKASTFFAPFCRLLQLADRG